VDPWPGTPGVPGSPDDGKTCPGDCKVEPCIIPAERTQSSGVLVAVFWKIKPLQAAIGFRKRSIVWSRVFFDRYLSQVEVLASANFNITTSKIPEKNPSDLHISASSKKVILSAF